MVPQVIVHKCRYEIVAVIVTVVAPQFEFDTALAAGCLEQMRMKLLLEKLIIQSLVDQDSVRWRL